MRYQVKQYEHLTGDIRTFEAQSPTQAQRTAENLIMNQIKLTSQIRADIRKLIRARLSQGEVIEIQDNDWINNLMKDQIC